MQLGCVAEITHSFSTDSLMAQSDPGKKGDWVYCQWDLNASTSNPKNIKFKIFLRHLLCISEFLQINVSFYDVSVCQKKKVKWILIILIKGP